MEISCDQCQSKFRIQDDKIPPDKTIILSCPKCKNKISVSAPKKTTPEPTPPPPKPPDTGFAEDTDDSGYDPYEEESFDFVEEEGSTALICEIDPELRKMYKEGLAELEFHVTETDNIRDALTKMRYHNYDLIVVNEKFGAESTRENSILIYLQRLPMSIRRKIFVTMISETFRTKDYMAALNKSVNLIVNKKNLQDFQTIVKRAIMENDLFFKIFRETLKEEGRA